MRIDLGRERAGDAGHHTAAHRAGIRTVILPKDNQKDLADIPANIKDEFTLHFVENMDEVLKVALTHVPTPLIEDGAQDLSFRPGMGDDGDLQQESTLRN